MLWQSFIYHTYDIIAARISDTVTFWMNLMVGSSGKESAAGFMINPHPANVENMVSS
jgi:hypothetical protein